MMKLAKTCFIAAVAAGATLSTMAEESKLDAKSAEIVQRMKAIRLPEMEFAPPKTIIDAVEFFRVASKKYDSTEIPEEKRGFNFVLRTDGAEWSAPTIPMIKASDISFYDALKFVCDSIDYTFDVLPCQVVRVMSKENYAQMEEDEKKAKIEKSAGKSGKESKVSRKNKPKRPFKSYRFCVDSTRDPTDCMQLSEFELLDAAGKVIPSKKFKFGFAEGDDDDFGDGETPECAVDGKLDTKWLDFRAEQDADAERRAAVWIQFTFANPTKISGYRWYTANDDEDRDPRSWRLLGSNDGVNWVVVDKVEDFEATSDRKTLAYTAHL